MPLEIYMEIYRYFKIHTDVQKKSQSEISILKLRIHVHDFLSLFKGFFFVAQTRLQGTTENIWTSWMCDKKETLVYSKKIMNVYILNLMIEVSLCDFFFDITMDVTIDKLSFDM